MTQAICDITTDEVNVDVVVEPQADTMVEVANRAGGMEQVFHDNTLIGNGNSVDLGVNTEIIATKEYVDEKVESIDTYTKDQIDGKFTAVNADLATRATKTELENAKTVLGEGIQGNADAILKTRNDYEAADQEIRADMNSKDSELETIINDHAERLNTLRTDVDDLGDQVAEIESKIPESASATNQLATKADLANIDLDGYVKKSGDTMTGDLSFDVVDDKYKNIVWNPESEVWVDDITVETRKYLVGPKIVSTGFDILQQYPTYKNASVELGGVSIESDRFYPARSDGVMKLGLPNRRWDNVYTTNINNGNDLIVPTEGGTLARIEDLIDLRADINEADSELQTQITAQAAEIATKQDQLTAGDNIVISNNVISATGAGGGAGFDIQVVQELPATGQKGIIYLLAKDGAAPDAYDEYVWIETTQTFELIGTTQVDLTDYAKKTYVDSADQQLKTNQDSLYANQVVLSGMLNTKDAGGNWTTLTTTAQAAIPAINELNEKIASSGGDYLPLSGGTMTGVLNFDYNSGPYGNETLITFPAHNGVLNVLKTGQGGAGLILEIPATSGGTGGNYRLSGAQFGPDSSDGEKYLGYGASRWKTVFATRLCSTYGFSGFNELIIPDKAGTLARIEDINAIGGDGTAGQVLTKTDDGMAWQDSTGGGGSSLPDQTGNAGKFLQTDGTTASWGNALVNRSGNDSLWLGGGTLSGDLVRAVVLYTGSGFVVVGSDSIAIGTGRASGLNAICIGGFDCTGSNAIQLGGKYETNQDPNTFKVGNANGNFEMMSADGTIPAERMSATAGTTGQVLTKTDTGMAWADASGGDGDIDCGVMS